MFQPLRTCAVALLFLAGCSELSPRLDGSLAVVEVIETARPVALNPEEPLPLYALPVAPELVYLQALPVPAKHVIAAGTTPAAARSLRVVQSVEIDVEVEGGEYGAREISLVFVSPQGLVWERQATVIEASAGARQVAHFSLPVASTFIEDQHLAGTWQINSLDDGLELASTTFVLEE